MKKVSTYVYFIFVLITLVACSGGTPAPEVVPEAAPETAALSPQQATITCTERCLNSGQCGLNTTDNTPLILGNRDGPQIIPEFQNIFFNSESTANLLEETTRFIQPINGGDAVEERFYKLEVPEQGKTGWVIGWCVALLPGQ